MSVDFYSTIDLGLVDFQGQIATSLPYHLQRFLVEFVRQPMIKKNKNICSTNNNDTYINMIIGNVILTL